MASQSSIPGSLSLVLHLLVRYPIRLRGARLAVNNRYSLVLYKMITCSFELNSIVALKNTRDSKHSKIFSQVQCNALTLFRYHWICSGEFTEVIPDMETPLEFLAQMPKINKINLKSFPEHLHHNGLKWSRCFGRSFLHIGSTVLK